MASKDLHPLQRHVGDILMGIGAIHTGYAVLDLGRALVHAGSRGWPGFLTEAPSIDDRYTLWFVAAGIGMLMLAGTTRQSVRATGAAPHIVGWGLIGMTILCVAIEPQTGAYSLLLPAGIILSMPDTAQVTRPV